MKIIEENKNKSAITTKYVVNNNSIIVSVFYDEDGDWQFLGEEEVSEEDAIVVSIQEMIDIDKSLVNLPDLKEDMKKLVVEERKKDTFGSFKPKPTIQFDFSFNDSILSQFYIEKKRASIPLNPSSDSLRRPRLALG